MQKHEKKPLSIDKVTEKMEYQSTLDMVALKNFEKLYCGTNK